MKPWLILLNNFSHDLFTGLWFGSFVTLFLLREKTSNMALPADSVTELNQFFFNFCLVSLLLISVSGLFRFFYYRDWDDGKHDAPELKRKMLIVKHAFFGSSFLIGTILAYTWTF
jgi:hypothetical protein